MVSEYYFDWKSMMNKIPVLVISLSERVDRRIKFRENWELYHPEFLEDNYEFFDAIKAGISGCHLSHVLALSFAYQQNWDQVCILEDDCYFKPTDCSHIIKYLGEPDLFYLGYSNLFGMEENEENKENEVEKIAPGIMNLRNVCYGGSHAIIYKRHIIEMILEFKSDIVSELDDNHSSLEPLSKEVDDRYGNLVYIPEIWKGDMKSIDIIADMLCSNQHYDEFLNNCFMDDLRYACVPRIAFYDIGSYSDIRDEYPEYYKTEEEVEAKIQKLLKFE